MTAGQQQFQVKWEFLILEKVDHSLPKSIFWERVFSNVCWLSSLFLVLEEVSEDLEVFTFNNNIAMFFPVSMIACLVIVPWFCGAGCNIPQNGDPLAKHPQSIFDSSAHFSLPLIYFELKTFITYRQNEHSIISAFLNGTEVSTGKE